MEFSGISFVLLTIETRTLPYMENNRTAGNIWRENLKFLVGNRDLWRGKSDDVIKVRWKYTVRMSLSRRE